MRGGAREGAGRPACSRKYFMFRLTVEEMRMLRLMGGSKWIQDQIIAIGDKKMTTTIDTTRFTEEEQDAFIEGWEEAGGVTDDAGGENPRRAQCPTGFFRRYGSAFCDPPIFGVLFSVIRIEDLAGSSSRRPIKRRSNGLGLQSLKRSLCEVDFVSPRASLLRRFLMGERLKRQL